MEKTTLEVIVSQAVNDDISDIYDYGAVTFGEQIAATLAFEFYHIITGLSVKYLMYPECRHLETKTQIYRNVIVGKYLIIYRIKAKKIEVLRVIHGSRSPAFIKRTKSINP